MASATYTEDDLSFLRRLSGMHSRWASFGAESSRSFMAARSAKYSEIADNYEALLAACERAERFITNGIEMGYIQLPSWGDPALETLPMLKSALARKGGEA